MPWRLDYKHAVLRIRRFYTLVQRDSKFLALASADVSIPEDCRIRGHNGLFRGLDNYAVIIWLVCCKCLVNESHIARAALETYLPSMCGRLDDQSPTILASTLASTAVC